MLVANVIFIRNCKHSPSMMESIDATFRYIKWNWESREVLRSLELFPQAVSYLEEETAILATIIQRLAFVATTGGCIRVFSLEKSLEMGSTPMQDRNQHLAYHVGEMPVALESTKVGADTYLLLVTKTAANLYRIAIDRDVRVELQLLCGVRLNSRVAKEGVVKDNRYLYTLSFTAAAMFVGEEELSEEPSTLGDASHEERKSRTEKLEENKSGSLCTTALAKDVSFEQGAAAGESTGGEGKKDTGKRRTLMVYLADSRAFLHVYRVTNFEDNATQ